MVVQTELMQKVRYLELKARRLVTDAMAGEYASAFRGAGMEFDKVREYIPGDDVRAIDWNVTARMHTPFIKMYREERELTVYVWLDVSPSMHFGTGGVFKHEVAAEFAAALGCLTLHNHDNMGLGLFSPEGMEWIPAKKGRAHVWQVIYRALTQRTPTTTWRPAERGTEGMLGALERLLQVCKRRSLVFLMSDFYDDLHALEKPLRLVSKRHELTCVHIVDPWEAQLPDIGVWDFADLEDPNMRFVWDTSSQITRQAYQAEYETRARGIRQLCSKVQAGYLSLSTGTQPIHALSRYLRQRRLPKGRS